MTPAAFEVIPAIDLLSGQCVRLHQGRYDDVDVFSDQPASVAADFVGHGIARLHVVDLDGARAGEPRNGEAIGAIVRAAGKVPVQLGGGIRSLAAVEGALALGVERVVLGTVALRDPEVVRAAAAQHPGRIGVGIDAKDGRVAVEGWVEESEVPVLELAKRFEGAGVAAIIHTDIARDGMGTGPNLEATAELAAGVSIPVIASGGIGSEDDVARAAAFASRGITGVIVGQALYTGAVDLGRVLAGLPCS